MDLPNPKDLRALLKVCREYGVESIEVASLKMKLGEMPQEERRVSDQESVALQGPTEEELAFWSAAPDPLAKRLESQ